MSYPLLERINAPGEIKNLPASDMPALCEEIRQFLIKSVSETGGHLKRLPLLHSRKIDPCSCYSCHNGNYVLYFQCLCLHSSNFSVSKMTGLFFFRGSTFRATPSGAYMIARFRTSLPISGFSILSSSAFLM